ncbi:uncharacterized protein I206_102121 [Kwoniella pini CBS 10737]|uniref:Transglycosylase SLT domain-containing protein n=1 Tax=Kwoniella pini CBS 10737 TaxID=1296096 RepID=A0A1B9HUR3_9TREE|nr:uncharacterized protein I206_06786 [Kwoniella pini CBS 10737]OCF47012.1 hypothetical protein I206_06786 [Kwoniella pini CBS 10737]
MLPSIFTLIAAFLPLLTLTSASTHSPHPPHLRHRRISQSIRHIKENENSPRAIVAPRDNAGHSQAKKVIKKNIKKRGGQQCRPRQAGTTSFQAAVPTATTASASASAVSSSSASSVGTNNNDNTSVDNAQAWIQPSSAAADTWTAAATTTSSAWSEPSQTSNSNSGGLSVSGLLAITDHSCGYSNADDNAPNGVEGWLNCGVDGSGWNPPMVTADQLIAAELTSDGVFSPCGPYIDKFNQYASEFGLKGIMLASFAMQESTCNPSATGGNGEAGLMQLAQINCGGAPNGNCYDIDFNIKHAAELFSNLIKSNNGNVLTAIGSYNGWQPGLTINSATEAKNQGRCAAQNNLDYIHQFCNGWMQGKSGYELGTYCELICFFFI